MARAAADLDLAGVDVVLVRTDPPFDLAYLHSDAAARPPRRNEPGRQLAPRAARRQREAVAALAAPTSFESWDQLHEQASIATRSNGCSDRASTAYSYSRLDRSPREGFTRPRGHAWTSGPRAPW
ncbi:MAG: hypothetical protein ACR2O6_14215 [Ilumatobacteraceae bacterium]